MDTIVQFISQPWPWWVSGPLLGLLVPLLLLAGNKEFGISSTLRHICAAVLPAKIAYLKYDWKKSAWQLSLAAGIILGGVLAAVYFQGTRTPDITPEARGLFLSWGILDQTGLAPSFLKNWQAAFTVEGLLSLVLGGFLVGFGTRWANGCTSGHAIMGLSLLNLGSLVATIGFFAGGTLASWYLVPLILSL